MAIDIFKRLPDGTKVKIKDITEYKWRCSGEVLVITGSEKDDWFEEHGWCYIYEESKGVENCIWGIDIECVVEETPVWVNQGVSEKFPEADMAQEIERLEGVNKFLLAKCREQQEEFKKLKESYDNLKKDYFVELMDSMAFTDMINEKLDFLNCHIENLQLEISNEKGMVEYYHDAIQNLNWFQKLIIGYDNIRRGYYQARHNLPKNPIIRREDRPTNTEEKAKYEEGIGTGY